MKKRGRRATRIKFEQVLSMWTHMFDCLWVCVCVFGRLWCFPKWLSDFHAHLFDSADKVFWIYMQRRTFRSGIGFDGVSRGEANELLYINCVIFSMERGTSSQHMFQCIINGFIKAILIEFQLLSLYEWSPKHVQQEFIYNWIPIKLICHFFYLKIMVPLSLC